MELALHIRYARQKNPLEVGLDHLKAFCEENGICAGDKIEFDFDRVYTGDEFCVNRLPDTNELKDIIQVCGDSHKGLSFLLPPLTNVSVEKCRPLFQLLRREGIDIETVVNDMGTLFYLKENYPDFSLSMGRLFNKGFKDPRFKPANNCAGLSDDMRQLLNESTFDQPEVMDMARQLAVARMERDLFPFENKIEEQHGEIGRSIYFPFGYITSGRVCRLSAMSKKGRKKFLINSDCNQYCNGLPLLLKNGDTGFTLVQNGNTVFYLYPPAVLKCLLKTESAPGLRMVYQGVALI